jgi:hypothetical protein
MRPAGVMTPYLVKSRMSYYNIRVSVRRILVINEYSLHKIGGNFIQQNGTVQVQKYECRLRKSKKAGKAAPPKTMTMVV